MNFPEKTFPDSGITRSINPRICCLICTTPRSGSTLFCQGLESTNIAGIVSGAPHELFLPATRAKITKELITQELSYYIKEIQKNFKTANGVFTTKIMWRHFFELQLELRRNSKGGKRSDLELVKLAFGNVRFIYLKRFNKIDQAISILRARQSGIWHRNRDQNIDHKTADRNESKEKFQFLQIFHYENSLTVSDNCWQNFFKSNGISPLTIIYEELVDDFDNKIFGVLKYLGLDEGSESISPQARVRKLSDSRSREWAGKFKKMKKIFFWLRPLSIFFIRVNQALRLYRFKKIFIKKNCNW